ncbi:hypothetical protein B7486_65930 [cyanobacterium TDX16]|nr:hypothetical protein B7486_65930 [cyanobacterium TDX16]
MRDVVVRGGGRPHIVDYRPPSRHSGGPRERGGTPDMHTDETAIEAPTTERPTRRKPALLAAALVAFALLLLGACGDDDGGSDDTTTTTEAEEETTTTEDEDAEDEDEAEDEEAEEFDPSDGETEDGGEIAMDSETDSYCLAEGESVDYEITVPDGVDSTLIVTPYDGGDIVVEAAQETVDEGLSDEPEVLEGTGPIEETVTIYEFYGDAACFDFELTSS